MMDAYSDTRQLSLYAEDMIERKIGRKTFVANQAPEFSALFKRFIGSVVGGVRVWNRRRIIENDLYALSDHLLEDIGVVRGDIPVVARKWASSEVNRIRSERRVIKAIKSTKAADVAPFVPATAATIAAGVVANDDTQVIAA